MLKNLKKKKTNFWKINKITRFGITKLWGVYLQLQILLKTYKYSILDISYFSNIFYCYIHSNLKEIRWIKQLLIFTKKQNDNRIKIKIFFNLFHKKIFLKLKLLILNLIIRICNIKIFYLQLFHLQKNLTNFKKLNFNFYLNKKCRFKQIINFDLKFKLKIKKKLKLKNLLLLLNYYLKNKTSHNFIIYLKLINHIALFNLNWFENRNLLKNILKQLNFKFEILTWLIIFYFCEKFKQIFLIASMLWFVLKNSKTLKKKKFSLQKLYLFESIFFFLRTTKCIFLKGLIVFLGGKIKRSMRKSKYFFTNGKISSSDVTVIKSSANIVLVSRASLINLKITGFF